MLRDQLDEQKINSARIRERLLVESDLKLDKAIKLARLVETAIKEAKSMPGESRMCAEVNSKHNGESQSKYGRKYPGYSKIGQQQSRDHGNVQARANFPKKCYRCESKHLANLPNCPARSKTRRACGSGGKVQKVDCSNDYGADVQALCSKTKSSKICYLANTLLERLFDKYFVR